MPAMWPSLQLLKYHLCLLTGPKYTRSRLSDLKTICGRILLLLWRQMPELWLPEPNIYLLISFIFLPDWRHAWNLQDIFGIFLSLCQHKPSYSIAPTIDAFSLLVMNHVAGPARMYVLTHLDKPANNYHPALRFLQAWRIWTFFSSLFWFRQPGT